jgi:hypothetical protein
MTEHDTPEEEDIDRGIIEIEQDDGLIDFGPEELREIAERIRTLEPASLEPADIEEAASRVAAVIAEYSLRFRNVVEAMRCGASAFHARLNGIIPKDRGLGLSDEEAISAAERLFDAIMAALEEDALRAILECYSPRVEASAIASYRC